MKTHFDKEIPGTRFEEVIKSEYINSFNPIKEFVKMNNNRNPSGTFEAWVDCITPKNEAIDCNIVLHFPKKWCVEMIAQALNGEFLNEFFITLLSTDQGIEKSTFLRKFVLPEDLR